MPDPATLARRQVVAARMRALIQTEEWDAFLAAALEMRDQRIQRLITGTAAEFPALQGEIQGMDALLRLPQALIKGATHG